MIVVVLGIHVVAFAGISWSTPEKITPLPDIAVEVIPQGETVTETSVVPTPEAAPEVTSQQAMIASPESETHEAPEVETPKQEEAPATPALTAPRPKIESEDAPPIAVEQAATPDIKKSTPVTEKPHRPDKEKRPEAKRRAAPHALTRGKREVHARQFGRQAQLGAPAIRAGVKNGSSAANRMSRSAYGALVSAEINRHKTYPASARSAGIAGSVGVVFSVGASGAIVSHSITRSSGNGALDAAVHGMMAAAHPPPPPGGHFRGSVTIHFNLGR
ncbi:MAG: hypothetical protein NTAFB05_08700 [Nitrobacter sp.]|uniref:TonB family protein n=1 Tax=Nitrobacter sp. TaxID=29420 RepID=UPI00387DDFC6